MRLKHLLTTIYLSAATLVLSAQTTITIGTGTNTARFPLGHLFGYERSVALYTAAEIGQAGIIERIAWNGSTAGPSSRPIKMYMAHTSASTLTTNTYASFLVGAQLIVDSIPSITTTTGWNEFNLTNPFNYDGSSNLLVIVEMNRGTWVTGSPSIFQTSVTGRHLTWSADGSPPAGNGTAQTTRPNIRIRVAPLPITDLSINATLSPALVCNRNSYDLSFRIRNSGSIPVTSGGYVRYGYYLNNGTPVIDSVQISSDLVGSNTLDVSFPGVSFSGTGNQTFRIWVGHNTDADISNDSSNFVVNNANCQNTFPFNDFEINDGGWTSSGLWAWGAINKGSLTGPPSGTNGWITGTTGQYPNNQNATLTSPLLNFENVTCAASMTWDMRFNTENNWDGMVLEVTTDGVNWVNHLDISPAYNNTSTSGPVPPPKFSGNNTAWTTYVADLSSYVGAGAIQLRFRFGSDGSGQNDGVAIDDLRIDGLTAYTGANFSAPDTLYRDAPIEREITNLSPLQSGLVYEWYADGASIGNDYNFRHQFNTAGIVAVKLVVRDACGNGLDSFTKNITIIMPTNKPEADFVADRNIASAFQPINFDNLTTNGAATFEWIVSPATIVDPITLLVLPSVSYSNGTNEFSKSPQMSFFANGSYEVCLIAENVIGRDTICKPNYIIVGGVGGSSYDTLMCSGFSSNAQSGVLYDSGGPNGNYQDSENCSFTIDFPCYDSLLIDINFFDVENGWDFFQIYDGDQSGTPLWNVGSFPNGLTGFLTNPAIQPARSGRVTVVLNSDGVFNNPGFELNYQAVSPKGDPIAGFTVGDTLCASYPVFFNNTSVYGNSFHWDFLGSGANFSTDKNPTWTYSGSGNYRVRLVAEGCGDNDTAYQNVVVVSPSAINVNFGSTSTVYNTNDVVMLYDSTLGCTDSYQWEITPSTFTVVEGTINSPVIGVRFDSVAVYSVKLVVSNSSTVDSLLKPNYITIVEKCTPTIVNNNPDMGISRVVLNTIDNRTETNLGYRDYRNISTNLEKGLPYTVTIYRGTVANQINRRVWIDWNADGDFDDAGELILTEGPANTVAASSNFTVPTTAADGQVNMRVSTSYGNQINNSCGVRSYGETEDYRLILIPDVIPPVITLFGNNPDTINRLTPYVDLGASAIDNLDGNISSNISVTGSVDVNIAGTYDLHYNVSDASGNEAVQVTRTVVVLPDAPTIVLNGNAVDTIEVFDVYVDLGANGQDYNATPLTEVRTGVLNTSVVGIYILTYTVTDSYFRNAVVTREVHVVDRTAPTATLVGADTIQVEVYSALNDPGVNATDNYCAANTLSITTNTIDLTTIGFQTLEYTVTDCHGNTFQISRVVEVVDSEAPVITLLGEGSANVTRPRPYVDAGYTVSDNYNVEADITIDTITTLVNTETPGLYTWRYRATDASGNQGVSDVRFIFVMDNVGLNDLVQSKLNAYPNPNKGNFTIEHADFAGENVSLRIVDVAGRLVTNETLVGFTGSKSIDLSERGAGVYMVFLTVGQNQAVARVIIH